MTKYQAKSYKTRVEIDLHYQGLIPDPCQLTWRSLNLSLSDHSPLNSMSIMKLDVRPTTASAEKIVYTRLE